MTSLWVCQKEKNDQWLISWCIRINLQQFQSHIPIYLSHAKCFDFLNCWLFIFDNWKKQLKSCQSLLYWSNAEQNMNCYTKMSDKCKLNGANTIYPIHKPMKKHYYPFESFDCLFFNVSRSSGASRTGTILVTIGFSTSTLNDRFW